ncbi:MAG: efflux RND transporter periplasmic adaptor subunit [Nitrospira sp. SB0677_bin_15]|nr:efflux RND transporter periplasmic adaptor subunit [Nitrospira sp. SB0677_bin_15]MYH02455.1 efflux RND transporter periplasmic adaptor subunit [Nitrospira sp. SB0675_bin_23]
MDCPTRVAGSRHAGGTRMTDSVDSVDKKSKILKIVLPLLIIGLAVLGAQALMTLGPTVPKVSKEVKPTFVEVLTARVRDEQTVIAAYGTVQRHQRLIVQPEISGRVVKLNPRLVIGETLNKGAVLLQIDPRDYQVAVNEQRASLAKAEFDLKVELGNQAVAKREWSLLNPSAGEVNTLSRQLALRRPHLKEKRMALAAAKSRLHRAQLDLKRTILRTPFNALVLNESVEVGQLINSQSSVATLVGTDEFRVQVSVPIQQVEGITFPGAGHPQGSSVRVIRERGGGEPVVRQGTVVELLGDVTENGRMAQVLVSIVDPLELAKPARVRRPLLLGEYVRVEIQGPELHDVIVLPREAIREGSRVWVKNAENQLDVRPVDIVLSRKDAVLIGQGLRDGEEVIMSQVPAAIPGLPLQTVEELHSPESHEPERASTVSTE